VQVGSLRAGRFYAVRLLARASAELDGESVAFSDTYTSGVVPFRTVPCTPGQMQAPSLARRDRTLLKVRWQPGCGGCVDVVKEAAVAWANRILQHAVGALQHNYPVMNGFKPCLDHD
jgi:hypothetical protein